MGIVSSSFLLMALLGIISQVLDRGRAIRKTEKKRALFWPSQYFSNVINRVSTRPEEAHERDVSADPQNLKVNGPQITSCVEDWWMDR